MRYPCKLHLSVLAILLASGAIALAADPKVEDQIVGPAGRGSFVLSEHGLHVATVGMNGSRMAVTVDGLAGPAVDQILLPNGQPFGGGNSVGVSKVGDINLPVLLTPDGDHYAYAARMGNDAVVFHDGKEIARGPNNASVLNFGPLCFSPNGKHLFFVLSGTDPTKRQFMMDGKPLPLLPQESPPAVLFSQDDSHYAYYSMSEDRKKSILVVDGKDAGYLGDQLHFTADNRLVTNGHAENKSILLIDGKPGNHGEGVGRILVAKAGNKIVTINTRANPGGQLYFLVVDGKKIDESECLNDITKIVFSADGKRYMARCVGNGSMWMIVDGKKEMTYNGIGDEFSFSADSTKYAYYASNGGGQFIVVDGKESEAASLTPRMIFSPTGSRFAYITGENRLKMQVTVDGKTGPVHSDIPEVVFSPDGSRYGYKFNTASTPSLNVDGAEQTGAITSSFLFSPNGKNLLIAGQRSTDHLNGLLVNNQLVYRQAGRFTRQLFSPDGTHLYWAAVETGQPVKLAIYLDGKSVMKLDANANSVFETMPESWDIGADGILKFLAATPEGMKKITVTPAADSSVDTMIADAKSAEEKTVADAAQKRADADAAKAKAAADAQKAREDAAAARLKSQQDAAAARAKAQQDAAAARAARRGQPPAPQP